MDPDDQKASRFRKLKYRSKYIDIEFEETYQIFKKAKAKWVEAIVEYCKENKTKNPLCQDEPKPKAKTKEESTVFSSTQIKDLYRKIAIETHPDKNTGKSEKEIKKKQELYNMATSAKKEKDIDALISIGIELEMDLSNLDMRCLNLLEKQLDQKEQEIAKMRKDIAWHWYYAIDAKRDFIISKICPKPDKEV